jgi:hypothetical protein
LTCGIHSKDHPDGLVYIHRRMDAYLFRSLASENGALSLGLAHLSPNIVVEEMK